VTQPTWELVLADETGANTSLLTLASERQVTYQLNGATVIECSLPLTSDAAALITPGRSRIKAYRRGVDDDTSTLRAYGTIWTMEESAGDSGIGMARIVAVDPYGTTLARRHNSTNHGAIDQGTLIKTIIDTANATSATFVATDSANITASSSVTIDWTLTPKPIAEAMSDVANAQDGSDWQLSPVDSGEDMADLIVYGGQRGSTQDDAVFGYGAGTVANCTAFKRTYDMEKLATWVHGDGQGGAWFEWTNDTQSAAYGRHEAYIALSDVTAAAQLSALTYRELVTRYPPLPVIGFTAGLRAPRIFDVWNIGDTVRAQARYGTMTVDERVRVIGATIAIDDNGVESIAQIVTQADVTEQSGSTSDSQS